MPTDHHRAIELLGRTPYGRVSASRRALPFTTVTLPDGVPFDPVFLRVEPEFVTLHHLTEVPALDLAHSG
ncbi:hypothetical protein [Streptomyces sp. NRRL S-337]|uniref:hypothetical protein n=1 Tax=Streptomyces sp. NRRL S-337 TaxID=1463900 RepID=UPI0004C5A041|nr:hypothetical protein [Streptomyces sp. NRRL S-337]